MSIAAIFTPDPDWKRVYRRLAVGLSISFITLSLGNAEIWQGFYQTASLGDAMWILPFAFYPWAASERAEVGDFVDRGGRSHIAATSRPWVIFGGLALLPLIDYGLRRAVPAGPFDTFQDLSMAVAIVSVLPLLMARLAVERAELRQVDAKLRLMGAAVEEANELIVIVSRDGLIRHANRAFCEAVGYELTDLLDTSALIGGCRGIAVEAGRSQDGDERAGLERHARSSPQRRLDVSGGVRGRSADERQAAR